MELEYKSWEGGLECYGTSMHAVGVDVGTNFVELVSMHYLFGSPCMHACMTRGSCSCHMSAAYRTCSSVR